MLNCFLYHLSSGHAWFSCGTIFLVILALDQRGLFSSRPKLARVARILLLSSLCVATATATPVSLWLAVPLVLSCLAYAFAGFASRSLRLRRTSGLIAGGFVIVALVFELPYHLVRPPRSPPPEHVYVVADSLAAGLGGEKMTWPRRLAELSGVEVRDLSFPGANARSALRQQIPKIARDVDAEVRVLISIGGNDMLGPTSPAEFAENLDHLLAEARGDPRHPRTVLMLELPLIPGAWQFAAHQRRLAAVHGVVLIPKRLMAGVILDEADVLDGLHLSPAGHERMARELVEWVR